MLEPQAFPALSTVKLSSPLNTCVLKSPHSNVNPPLAATNCAPETPPVCEFCTDFHPLVPSTYTKVADSPSTVNLAQLQKLLILDPFLAMVTLLVPKLSV